jgi:hypothetical protein
MKQALSKRCRASNAMNRYQSLSVFASEVICVLFGFEKRSRRVSAVFVVVERFRLGSEVGSCVDSFSSYSLSACNFPFIFQVDVPGCRALQNGETVEL